MAHFASADAYALYDDAKLVLGALVANRVPSVAASNSDSCARRILDSLGLGTYFADVYLNFSYEIGHTKLDRWFYGAYFRRHFDAAHAHDPKLIMTCFLERTWHISDD